MNEEQIKALWLRVTGFDNDGDAADIIGFARALLADGGKGEAVAGYVIPQRLNSDDPVISLYRKPEGGARFPLYAAPQAECAPRKYVETQPGSPNFDGAEAYEAHLNAECAPREAQPVGPRTTLNYDGTFDTTCAHCGGNGCFACLKSAAPTPERADADTAGASERDALKQKGIDDHLRRLQQDGMKSEERADAGKDAALTDERAKEIAQQVHAECSRIPGATFYNAAMSAIEQGSEGAEMNDELLIAVRNLIQAADAYLEGYEEPAVVPFNTRRGSFGALREAYAKAVEQREKEK